MELKDFYLDSNDVWGKAQIFKELEFYPIKITDKYLEDTIRHVLYHNKKEFLSILEENKQYDSIQYVYRSKYLKSYLMTVLSSSPEYFREELDYIRYIIIKICKLDELYEDKFDIRILSSKGFSDIKDLYNTDFYITIDIEDKKIVINEEEFDLIREMILKQNDMSLKAIELYNKEMENKLFQQIKELGGSSFSDEMFSFINLAKININDKSLQDYTLYQFNRHFYYAKQLKEYELNYHFLMKGLIKNRDSYPHYSTPYKEKGRYDSLLMSSKEFENSDISKSVNGIKLKREHSDNYDKEIKEEFKKKINANL